MKSSVSCAPHAERSSEDAICIGHCFVDRRGFAVAAAAPAPADLVLLHGKIHTEDPSRSIAQALAVRGNSIVAVGSDAAVGALIGPNTRKVDLGGRVVLPGIIDAHTHPAESAQDLGKCSLDDKPLAPRGYQEARRGLSEGAAGRPHAVVRGDHGQSVGAHADSGGLGLHACRPAAAAQRFGRTYGVGQLARLEAVQDHGGDPGSRGRSYRARFRGAAHGHFAGQCRRDRGGGEAGWQSRP